MLADWLVDEIGARWPNTMGYVGWETRSQAHPDLFEPVGLIDHHTAAPVPFPSDKLLTKCNVTIRPDGWVLVLAAGYSYDSGLGSPKVLDAVMNDRPLPPLGGLTSTINGNPFFIDIEVQHLGDGSPLPAVQRAALIATNAAICTRMNWNPLTRVIGHLEWAPDRKPDPRWDGFQNPMPRIRVDTAAMIGDTVSAKDWTLETWQTLVSAGLIVGDPNYYASGQASPPEYVHAENVVMRGLATRAGVTPAVVDSKVAAHAAHPSDKDGVHMHGHGVTITQDIVGVAT